MIYWENNFADECIGDLLGSLLDDFDLRGSL